jgi:tagaturonate reductase
MILSQATISEITPSSGLTIPGKELFSSPEKVLQFGTGVLLRGLPDYFIHEANLQGIFNGRVVVVKSTDKGSADEFTDQDALYTLCIRGLENGQKVDKKIINASLSRILSAQSEWPMVLSCASNPELKIIISNTTETGIKLVAEDVLSDAPPISFPGKLVSFLYQRYNFFNGNPESGMVILPTELIPENGRVLKEICLKLAELNNCDLKFIVWLSQYNDFCNTLVDRIVPGALPCIEKQKVQKDLGYEDNLMIMAEPYCLWAIETTNQRTKDLLSFSRDNPNVVITENINKYREIKLRLLNAPHTFFCALAFCKGYSTVREAMQQEEFKGLISELMYNEIIPAIVGEEINVTEASLFAGKVLDRFSNPFIQHEWLSISFQYTSKMLMRCIPILLTHYKRTNNVPYFISLGFAAYILFMDSKKNKQGEYVGNINGREYVINDVKASFLFDHWQKGNPAKVVSSILSDKNLWEYDLTTLAHFEQNVLTFLELLRTKGTSDTLTKSFIVHKQ